MEHFIITERCSTLRRLAREALRGRWKLALLAILVYSAAIYIPTLILTELFPMISSLYSLLVAGPFTLGYSIFALSLFRNDEPRVWQIFYGFEKFGKALGLYLLICLFVMLWALIIIPGVVVVIFVPFFLPFAFLLAAPAIIAAIRYSQAFFILADNPDMGVFECIAKSKAVMAGNKWKYCKLELSFIGWLILASIPSAAMGGIITAQTIQGLNMGMVNFQSDYAEIMQGFTTISGGGAIMVASIAYIPVMVYMMAAAAAFYEMASGNLRPGYIASTAEVLDDGRPEIIE